MFVTARVLHIGLDSADPALLLEWSHSGVMPVLGELLAKGSWTRLENTPGFGSGAMWPSIATGLSPAGHGRYFARQLGENSYKTTVYQATQIAGKPFWERISDAGGRIGVFDFPYMTVTGGLNGIQVSEWGAHNARKGHFKTDPPEAAAEIEAGYGTNTIGRCDAAGRGAAEFELLKRLLLERANLRTEMGCHYLRREDWDFFSTTFHDGHCAAHQLWQFHDPAHPDYDGQAADPLKQVYGAMDAGIGRLVEAAGDDALVVIFAGPGMGPNYTARHLMDDILLRLESRSASGRRAVMDPLKTAYRNFAPPALRTIMRAWADRVDEASLARSRSRRRCFALPHNDISGAVRINLAGREPNGLVEPGAAYEALCDQLTGDLKEIVNLDTGEALVDRVIRVDDVCSGPYRRVLPDLLVTWNRQQPILRIGSPKIGEITRPYPGNRTGDHNAECLFLASGPAIRPGKLAHAVSILDIAPSIMFHLGVALPQAEGKVISDLFAA